MEDIGTILKRAGVSPRRSDPPTAKPVCATCSGSGWLGVRAKVGERGFGQVRPCHTCKSIPGPTFDDFTTKGKTPSIREALKATREWVQGDGPGILVLSGGVGVGKTHLAASAYRELWYQTTYSEDARYYTDAKLLDAIHEGYRKGTFHLLMSEIERLTWLILDDLGVTALTETTRGAMERVIDLRWQGAVIGRRTLITTNLAADQFDYHPPGQPQVTGRIESRLRDRERVRSIPITGPDHRRTP